MIFEKIYVISLKNRSERLASFFLELPKNWSFGKIEIYEAIDGKQQSKPYWWDNNLGALGCFLSHKNIIDESIKNNISSVLIFEDDAVFCDDFINLASDFLSNVPDDWEMIYLGGQHLIKPEDKILNGNVAIGRNINRTHAYALQNKGLEVVQQYLNKTPWPIKHRHIDHYYGYLHKNKIVVPYCPLNMLVGQRDGYSDIINASLPKTRWWNKK